jgi:hypothetical protein
VRLSWQKSALRGSVGAELVVPVAERFREELWQAFVSTETVSPR